MIKRGGGRGRRLGRRVKISGENSRAIPRCCHELLQKIFATMRAIPRSFYFCWKLSCLNAMICEGWNQRIVLSYELNLLLFFLLFVLHEVEGTRATRDISDRIKRTDLFDSMASPKMKFMQTHFHARNLYVDKIMRFSWKIVKERERETRHFIFKWETTTLFLGIYLQQVFSEISRV